MVRENAALDQITADNVARKYLRQVSYQFEGTYGLPASTSDTGDPISDTGGTCMITSYAQNSTAYLIALPKTATTYVGQCPVGAGVAPTTAKLNRRDTYYDANFANLAGVPSAGNVVKVVDWSSSSVGEGTAYDYDNAGHVTGVIAPANLNLAATTYATAGAETKTEYTQTVGQPITSTTVTDPEGGVVVTELTPGRAQPKKITDANARDTRLSHDGLGELTGVTRPGDSSPWVTYAYDWSNTSPSTIRTDYFAIDGPPDVERTPTASSWTFHDALGRAFQTQQVGPGGTGAITSGVRFDDRGNTIADVPAVATATTAGTPITWYGTVSDAWPTQRLYVYDVMDRLYSATVSGANSSYTATTITAHDGTKVTTTYPPNAGTGQPNRTSDVVLNDWSGRPLNHAQGSAVTSYAYDVRGYLTSLTTPGAAVASYTYDWLGRRLSTTDPDAGASTATYWPGGAVKTTHDANGQDLYYTYDSLGRGLDVYTGTSAAGTQLTHNVYDATPLGGASALKGTLTSTTATVAGAAYTEKYGYDIRYRTTRLDRIVPAAAGALAGTYTTTYGYDGMDRPTTIDYPALGGLAAETVTAGYAGAYASTLNGDAGTYVQATGYDTVGRLAGRTLGAAGVTGSVQRAYAYDDGSGRLQTMTARTPSTAASINVQDDTYTYTPSGQVTSATDTRAGQKQCYTYDGLNRLTGAATVAAATACSAGIATDGSGPDPYSQAYAYLDNGNMTTRTAGGVTTTYTYGTTGALTGGPHAPTKATTGAAVASYSYNAAGQLTTKTDAAGTTTHTWTPFHQLAATTGAVATANTYGPGGDRWIRTTPTETVLYLPGQEAHRATGAATTTAVRYYTHAGATIAARTSTPAGTSTTSWLLGDAQGSASIGIDTATATQTRDRYLPYGGNRANSWTLPTDRGWLGQTRDTATGLDYLNARYYDPGLAHFISTDPLNNTSTPQAANPYTYGNDNPVTYTDPTGLRPACLDSGW